MSQFILDREDRIAFFQGIASRLLPGGYLASADLASDMTVPAFQSLLDVWFRLMKAVDQAPEHVEKMRAAYGRDVALLPVEEIRSIIESGGFETPTQFLQTGLIHAWYSRKV